MEFFRYVFNRFPSRAPFNPFGNVGYISSSVIALEKGLAEHISFTSISNSFASLSAKSNRILDCFCLTFNVDRVDRNVGIFQIKQICDTIHIASFVLNIFAKYHKRRRLEAPIVLQKRNRLGEIGNGMKYTIERGSVVREIQAVDGSKLIFKKLLPLMGVEFVRYGMLTVVPFPFKYLREYIAKEGKECKNIEIVAVGE